uniref:Integrase catalytic domain-containing protein n=1 Tax=Caenorhabditis japonica TaxID=281687 RepID=A0A8R1EVJ5_CAEJA
MTKAHNQEALTEALAALMTQLASSNELHRQLMEENRALRDAASAAEPPRATAGGTRVPHNVRLMSDLSRRIQKYSYSIGEPDSFKRWLSRHEPIFEEDGSELSEREKTRLLLGSLEETTFHRFVDSQRDVEDVYDAKLATMTADEWSVFLFFRGLDAPGDAAAKMYLMQFTEMAERKGETITLSQIHDEWMRFVQIKQQTKIVATSKQNPQTPVEVWKLEASKTKRRENPKFTPKWGSKDRRPPFCDYCKRAGHHISKCFLKRKDEGTETQSIKVDVVNAELSAKRSVRVNVNGKPLQFDLDTGSMITIINSESWNMIGRPPLERVEHHISCANGSEMRVLGRASDFRAKSQSPLMRKAMEVMVNQIEIPSAGMARLKDNPTVRRGNCQQNTKRTRITPSKPCPDTKKPWAHIYVDFAGPINGFWFLVVEDAKTKYAEVKLTRKASAAATVDLIEDIFATHGYPDWIVSDNGTQLSKLDMVNSGRSPRVVRQGVFGSSPAAHDTSRSDGFGRVNRGNQKMECRSELNEHQSPNSRTFLERKEEVSSPCKQQLESEVQQDVSCVQPAPNLSQSLRRSQRNRRAPVRYDPCMELQSHSEDRAPKRGSAPYSDRAAARSRGLHIASNCRLAPSQGRTKDNFVKGEGVGKAHGRPRWY